MNRYSSIRQTASVLVVILASFCLHACTKEDMSDCPKSTLRLRFDYNMLYADAFTPAVKEARVYLFDTNGLFLQSIVQQADPLYTLDLTAGRYSALVWAGDFDNSFAFTPFEVGTTTIDQCRATLQSTNTNLGALFWGRLDNFTVGTADVDHTVSLIKDTNRIRVILQHVSGETVNSGDFDFQITDTNGVINSLNNLVGTDTLRYAPYTKGQQTVGSDPAVTVAFAELATSRLIAGKNARLHITTTENSVKRTVMDVPLIDYLLLSKSAGGYPMTNQEYLDRQDEFTFHFFLDENNRWLRITIIINGWVIRINDVEI